MLMSPGTADLEPLADEAGNLLKALCHPARLMICCQLRDREMSVSEIEAALDIRQPRLSRELAKLREEGLVETRKQSRQVFYTLSGQGRVRAMVDAICAVMRGKAVATPGGLRHQRPHNDGRGGYGVFARTGP